MNENKTKSCEGYRHSNLRSLGLQIESNSIRLDIAGREPITIQRPASCSVIEWTAFWGEENESDG